MIEAIMRTPTILFVKLFLINGISASIVPAEQLYPNYDLISETFCSPPKRGQSNLQCIVDNIYQTDYVCRYNTFEKNRYKVDCYCSGAIYSYIEFGDICTRYSFEQHSPAPSKYGNAPIINLPFNWGEKPSKAVTEDGKPYPIIPIYIGYSHLNKTADPKTPAETIETVVNGLGDRMLAHLNENYKDTNLLFSSLSLHSVLALLYEGASPNSETRTEIREFMGEVLSTDILRNSYREITRAFQDEDQVVLKNDMYVTLNHTANTTYAKTMNFFYNAGYSYFNKSDANLAVEKMNGIISDNTKGYISNALDSVRDSDMFIINTLFLKVRWAFRFLKTRSPMKFTKVDGSVISVPAFEAETSNIKINSFALAYNEPTGLSPDPKRANLNIIRIPYAGKSIGESSDLEFRIYLGKWESGSGEYRKSSHNDLMASIKETQYGILGINLDEFTDKESENRIKIQIPSFKIRSKFRVEELLLENGVEKLFSDKAELSNMVQNSDGFYVSKISQAMYVDVSEKGTTAAGVTAVELNLLSAGEAPQVINIDAPFMFSVWSKKNNMPILAGVVHDPLDAS